MGFFQKIAEADIFVVLDNVNYRKNYFQNRNKIKLKNGMMIGLRFPLKKNQHLKI